MKILSTLVGLFHFRCILRNWFQQREHGKKAGASIDQNESNQMFVPGEDTKSKQFEEMMDDIPVDILTITQEIIVERYFNNRMLTNKDDILYSQMKKTYPKEMNIALKIKSFLENKYGTKTLHS